MSYFYLYSRAFIIRLYIRVRLILMTLIILVIETLLFNIISALIRVLIKYSLRIKVLVLKVNTLIALLLKRIKGAEDTLLFKLELELKGILYYLSFSSFSSLLELLVKESLDSNLLLNNPKLEKLNKILFIVRINR
jgi:hypothetical protein